MRAKLGYPSSLAVEISAELKQDIQRSRAWQHHNRMMKDRNGMPPPQDMRLYGSIELPNGGWLQFSSLVDKETASWSWQTTLNLLLVASLVIGLMIWLFRRATRPLKQLAANADRLGRGEDIEPLRGGAHRDPRVHPGLQPDAHPARSLRAGQNPDAGRHLPRPAHPITSLRLRSEFLADGEDKERFQQTLQQMEQMLAATLSFAREEGSRRRPGSWIWSACWRACVTTMPTWASPSPAWPRASRFTPAAPTPCAGCCKTSSATPSSTQGAEVSLVRGDGELLILVRDQGPGIAESQLEEVFKPFVRLDEARNTESGSVGLGLAIARTLVHQHGGELSLHNREEEGLEARISLPL